MDLENTPLDRCLCGLVSEAIPAPASESAGPGVKSSASQVSKINKRSIKLQSLQLLVLLA